MSSESEGDTGSTPSVARYRSIGTKRNRSSEEPDGGDTPVVKRLYTGSGVRFPFIYNLIILIFFR